MAPRENLVTAILVIVALPTAYLVQILLGSVNIGEQASFMTAFLTLIGVGVALPRILSSHME
jgi:hypothetical protein